jgi:hypothetical protein
MEKPKAFISYAHKPNRRYFKLFKEKLEAHSDWNIWTDVEIEIGTNWHNQIQEAIKKSDFAILLVSAEFLKSDYIKEHEFDVFVNNRTKFFPVLLADCDFLKWQELSKTQFFQAMGEDYGLPKLENEFISFAKLVRYDTDGVLIPNDYINTFVKNFVQKVKKSLA